jgi:hypothetical protein
MYWNGTHPSVFEFRVEKNGTTTSMPQELLFELNGGTSYAVIGAFLLQLIWPLRVYVLVLRTSGGDEDAVVSRNEEFVSTVQKAVEQAFVVRARQPPVSET